MKKSSKKLSRLRKLRLYVKTHPRKSALACVVAVLLIFGMTHIIQQEVKFRYQKQQFAVVEQDMQKTYDQIIATVGKPYESHKTSGCSYGSVKYGRGPLYCSTGYIFTNESKDSEASYSTTQSILNILSSTYKRTSLMSDNINKTQMSQQFEFKIHDEFSCFLQFDISEERIYNDSFDAQKILIKKINSPLATTYFYYCGNLPVKPIYELSPGR